LATWRAAVVIQTAVRYVLIGLGLVTLVLAAILAREGQWWAAIPDAGFGAGVAWVAFASLREERQERQEVLQPAPEKPAAPAPTPVAATPPEPPRAAAKRRRA